MYPSHMKAAQIMSDSAMQTIFIWQGQFWAKSP
jgi:hypothetical protein